MYNYTHPSTFTQKVKSSFPNQINLDKFNSRKLAYQLNQKFYLNFFIVKSLRYISARETETLSKNEISI